MEQRHCDRNNVIQLEIHGFELHILTRLGDTSGCELFADKRKTLIDVQALVGTLGSSHLLFPFLLLRLDTQEVIDSLLRHFDVEGLIHILNGEVIVVVDDAMLREHFDLRRRIVFGFDLKQFTVSSISRSVNAINLLNGVLFTIDKMIGFTIFLTSLCNQLEIEYIVTTIDCFFNRCTVHKILD